MKKRVTLDFETRSRCDLKKAGGYKYSLDPTTRPTCLAAKIAGHDNIMFLKFQEVTQPWGKLPASFRDVWEGLIDENYEFSAHNAFFEKCIYTNILVKRYGWPMIPFTQYRCTLAKAATCALPRGLEGAGLAMNLAVQKDRLGYSAMMATCKPTRQWKKWKDIQEVIAKGGRVTSRTREMAELPEPPMFLEPTDNPKVFQTLYDYCIIDVKAEELLDYSLPDLSPEELKVWQLNQDLNWRGLRVDVETVKKIVRIMADESRVKLGELDSLTMGLVTKPGATKSIREFLALEGITLPDLRAKTVEDALKNDAIDGDMRTLLELRKALSLTSTKKYQAFLDRASDDGRVRDMLMYHGASTGRDTGTGIQPHNFPRGVIKIDEERPYELVDMVVKCNDPELLKIMYGENLAMLFSSILRNMIIPSKGYELFVGDYSAIEVAVIWWLAGNMPGLTALREGKDPYKYQAASNTGKTYEEIPDSGDERQLGKAQVLGCGFGMGHEKFLTTAWDMYRLRLTPQQSFDAVKNYRESNPTVPLLWKDYERCAIEAVENPCVEFIPSQGRCRFFTKGGFLWIRLPSGRPLAYRSPQIAWRESEWGPRKTLEFWAVNSKTKKWALERTWGGTLTENIVQAVARDLIMRAIVELHGNDYKALLTVHDETICEAPIGKGDIDEFKEIMCKLPPWARGLPIRAKAWKGPRYRK